MLKKSIRAVCPPILWTAASRIGRGLSQVGRHSANRDSAPRTCDDVIAPDRQELDVYWNTEFAETLETWGEEYVWKEIQFFMAGREGAVLDIACGTGAAMQRLEAFEGIEVTGCDISDLLIDKAKAKGIPESCLRVFDATDMPFEDGQFVCAYSIGSLEHFTEAKLCRCIEESRRVTTSVSFHMVPVNRSGVDEGWIRATQAFFNNSTGWWTTRFRRDFRRVSALPSGWEDERSVGRWFVCEK